MATHRVRDHCLAPGRAVGTPMYAGRFGRLFPDLPPLATEDEFLLMLGRRGGACDGGLAADAAESDDAREAAGWPIFGQFIAHDITADRSPVTHHADAELIHNFRTPRVNLECVYGGGPVGSPYLFERDDAAKLLLTYARGFSLFDLLTLATDLSSDSVQSTHPTRSISPSPRAAPKDAASG